MDDGWSLEELADRVERALSADGVRAPNGRVRDVPDARAIRWYATIGLVDRPLVGPRRASRYTGRHLLQVVAVKRRQAEGRSLADIQAELTGATDGTLRAVARVPESLLDPAPPRSPTPTDAPAPARARFWADRPTQSPVAPAVAAAAATLAASATGPDADPAAEPVAIRYLVELAGGVALSLPRAPAPADLAAIRAAAAPLLDLLAARHLSTPAPTDDEGAEDAH